MSSLNKAEKGNTPGYANEHYIQSKIVGNVNTGGLSTSRSRRYNRDEEFNGENFNTASKRQYLEDHSLSNGPNNDNDSNVMNMLNPPTKSLFMPE